MYVPTIAARRARDPAGAGVRAGPARAAVVCLLAAIAALWTADAAAAQASGRIAGRVVTAGSGEPVSAAAVLVEDAGRTTFTSSSGTFSISDLPAGTHTLSVERLGYSSLTREVRVEAGSVTELELEMTEEALAVEEVVVSVTREARALTETPASVGVVGRATLEGVRPSHPSEVMGDIPGVWVNETSGEGHMTAIRQPLSTDPVYLYLEDGVPTRSTGFFNHNALYEVNLPQSQRVEVSKGPANALYGSDAIGGVINVTTRSPSQDPEAETTVEGGEHGYARFLASGSGTWANHGLRADLNVTRQDGWRSGTGYRRISGTARWDRAFGDGLSMKTVLSLSFVDQNTAGASALSPDDFLARPTLNYTPISYRDVGAVRLSTELEKRTGDWLLTLTPFFRSNSMEMLPNWVLFFDPAVWETQNRSVGALAKARRDFPDAGVRIVTGLDVDYSPGSRVETRVDPVREDGVFTDYVLEERIYDYDVAFRQISPYVHAEAAPVERLNLTAGLRADFMGYDYENHLGVVREGEHRRPPDASPRFEALSPKLGATFEVGPELAVFGAVRKGFRAPSEGDLFRQGSAENTLGLQPVKTWSYEVGARGTLDDRLSYELALYTMRKTDDILGFEQPDGDEETVNAGESRHRGVELGLGVDLAPGLRLDVAYSVAEHTFVEWSPEEGVDLAGREMRFAPNRMGNVELSYEPRWLPGARTALEWTQIGPYWEDQRNEHRYDGHDLLNLNLRYRATDAVELFARIDNLTDELYAERATYNEFRGEELAPGLPRTVRAGVTLR